MLRAPARRAAASRPRAPRQVPDRRARRRRAPAAPPRHDGPALLERGAAACGCSRRPRRAASRPRSRPRFEPDAHTHLRLAFDDGGPEVFFRDVRKFGKVLLLDAGRAPRAPRAPRPRCARGRRATRSSRRRAAARRPIKPLLLDQALLAGVGNIYADEALFLAGVRPARRGRARDAPRVRAARARACARVLRRSIETGGSSISDYVAPDGSDGAYQDERHVYARAGEPCSAAARAIRRVSSRSAAPTTARAASGAASLGPRAQPRASCGGRRGCSRPSLRGHRLEPLRCSPTASSVVPRPLRPRRREPRRQLLLLSCRRELGARLRAAKRCRPPPERRRPSRSYLRAHARRARGWSAPRLLGDDRQLALGLRGRAGGRRFELLLSILGAAQQRLRCSTPSGDLRRRPAPARGHPPELALGEAWRSPASRRAGRGRGPLAQRPDAEASCRGRGALRGRGRARRERARAARSSRAAPGSEGASRASSSASSARARRGATRRDAPATGRASC